MKQVAEVSVFRPIHQAYTYEVPEGFSVHVGSQVEVPLGQSRCRGVVTAMPKNFKMGKFKLKFISKVYPDLYRLSLDLLSLAQWMSAYYFCPLGEVLSAISPSSLTIKEPKTEEHITLAKAGNLKLTPAQEKALNEIISAPPGKPVLLHGVTGSGKTELYLRLVQKSLSRGQSCIYLVPEITLTRETLRKLEHRFSSMLVFHSGMTPAQRRTHWLMAKSKGPHLVVGPRSALFIPIENLGLIIVDEEHDSSYKQDSTPRYQGRDLAIVRAKKSSAQIVLGSATPSLESYRNALSGKYHLVSLTQRVGGQPLPSVQAIDLEKERINLGRKSHLLFSPQLIKKTKEVLALGGQVIYFLNRRGFSTTILCPACEESHSCPNCSVTLTFYKRRNKAICHHCAYEDTPPKSCKRCHAPTMVHRGTGTEKVHERLAELLPEAKILRVDGSGDSGDVQSKLAEFMTGHGDILLGTQMISKGLDSPNIRLCAALNADQGLAIPDFRSAEKDFQLLTQLAGRAGRGKDAGECLFQTKNPKHYAIRHALNHDFLAFYNEEIKIRTQLRYPPFSRLSRFIFSHTKEESIIKALDKVMPKIRQFAHLHHIQLLGPVPAPIKEVKNKTRWQLVAKTPLSQDMSSFLESSLKSFSVLKTIQVTLDRDPANMM